MGIIVVPPLLTAMFAMRLALITMLIAGGVAQQNLRGNLTTLMSIEDRMNETDVKNFLSMSAAWMLNTSHGADSNNKNASLQLALGSGEAQCCKQGWSCGGCGNPNNLIGC